MKGKTSKMIQEYRLNDDKIDVRAVGILNLILATILLLANISIGASQFLFDLRIQICLVIGIVYLGLCRYYDWRSVQMNVLSMIFYLFMIIIEILLLGIPGPILDNQPFNFSKGIMFELFLMAIPYLYIGLRIGMILPLIKIIYSSSDINYT